MKKNSFTHTVSHTESTLCIHSFSSAKLLINYVTSHPVILPFAHLKGITNYQET